MSRVIGFVFVTLVLTLPAGSLDFSSFLSFIRVFFFFLAPNVSAASVKWITNNRLKILREMHCRTLQCIVVLRG